MTHIDGGRADHDPGAGFAEKRVESPFSFKLIRGAIEQSVWTVAITIGALAAHALAIACIALLIIVANVLWSDFLDAVVPESGAAGSDHTIVLGLPLLCTIGVAILVYLYLTIKCAAQSEGTDDTFLTRIDATL